MYAGKRESFGRREREEENEFERKRWWKGAS